MPSSSAISSSSFRCIVADPPWDYAGKTPPWRSTSKQSYDLMKLEDICDLPVNQITTGDAHLYLWAVLPMMREAYEVVEAWGFTPETVITWCKRGPGLGGGWRGNTEHLIVARKGWSSINPTCSDCGGRARGIKKCGCASPKWRVKGKPLSEADQQRASFLTTAQGTWYDAPRRDHSEKPDLFMDLVEQMSPGPRLEMFARTRRLGWESWGNEVASNVMLASESERDAGETADETSGRSAYNVKSGGTPAIEEPLKSKCEAYEGLPPTHCSTLPNSLGSCPRKDAVNVALNGLHQSFRLFVVALVLFRGVGAFIIAVSLVCGEIYGGEVVDDPRNAPSSNEAVILHSGNPPFFDSVAATKNLPRGLSQIGPNGANHPPMILPNAGIGAEISEPGTKQDAADGTKVSKSGDGDLLFKLSHAMWFFIGSFLGGVTGGYIIGMKQDRRSNRRTLHFLSNDPSGGTRWRKTQPTQIDER